MPIVSGSGGGAPFNGGTITGALAVAPTGTVDTCLTVTGPVGLANDLMDILNAAGTGGLFVSPTGSVEALADANNIALIAAATNAISDVFQAQDASGAVLGAFKSGGALSTRQHSVPADGSLEAGECAIWFDQTNGVGNTKLMVKGKSADGTVKTASIVLA